MKKLVAGLVQQSCTADPAENFEKSAASIKKAASNGAELVLLQELHLGPYFCQTENPAHFDLAEPIPGPSSEAFASLARELNIVIVASIFEQRSAGLYHNTAVVIEKDGSMPGNTARCTSPTIRAIMKSTTSPPATWVFAPFHFCWKTSECLSAGTSGSRKPHD